MKLYATGNAAKTVESYMTFWKTWINFIELRPVKPTDVTETNMCLFATWLRMERERPPSAATIANYVTGVVSVARELGTPVPDRESRICKTPPVN